MAQSAFIKKMSHRHEELLQFMLANPTARLRELSLAFAMTPAWISTVINSQAFQAQLAVRQDEMFEGTVLTLRDKLCGLANQAVEKLGEQLERTEDPRLTLDVADKVLHRLGYAPKMEPASGIMPVSVQQNNFYTTNSETLKHARELMFAKQSAVPVEEGELLLASDSARQDEVDHDSGVH